jgi:large subunit ribosomal protein L15
MRGFTNIFRKEFSVVNLDRLAVFPENTKVTPGLMVEAGIVKDRKKPVKVLGRGELNVPLSVEAHRFSEGARRKIDAAGGSAKEIG